MNERTSPTGTRGATDAHRDLQAAKQAIRAAEQAGDHKEADRLLALALPIAAAVRRHRIENP